MIKSPITIDDQATPYLAKALAAMTDKQPIHQSMAEGGAALVQRHFAVLGVTNRNRFGAPSSRFWQQMLGGTTAHAAPGYGEIRMPRAVALRYFGGTVEPVRGEFLSLPARREAYNRSPRDFNDLRFVPTKRGGMLVQREQTKFSRASIGGKVDVKAQVGGLVMYWLVRNVTIRGDSGVLPDMSDLADACKSAGEQFIKGRLGLL